MHRGRLEPSGNDTGRQLSTLTNKARKRSFRHENNIGVARAQRWAFSCDNWNFNGSNPCLYVGGNYSQNQNRGLFYVNYNSTSNANANIGCRILLTEAKHESSRPMRGRPLTPWWR